MMTRAEERTPSIASEKSPKSDDILSSFDPMIEGSSFQAMDQAFEVRRELERAGIDPAQLAETRPEEVVEASIAAAVLEKSGSDGSFDLAESLTRIPNKLFFRIGDAAELLEVKPYVLRFWETEFPMVKPTKSKSGQRVYRKKDVEMLFLIKHLLYVERFSIEGARKRIRELRAKPARVAAQPGEQAAAATASGSKIRQAVAQAAQNAGIRSAIAPESIARVNELLDSARGLSRAELSTFFRF